MNYKQSIYLHIVTITLVLLGSIETVSNQLLDVSLLNWIGVDIIKRIILILIGISILYHLFNKYTYLPFLNYNVLPFSLLNVEKSKINSKNSISVDIDVPQDNPYIYIIYWASVEKEKSDIIPKWDIAYGEFTNSGVELINKKSKININVECPQLYKVPTLTGEKTIPKHIHYRFITQDGMMSKVFTKYISC